MSRNTTVLFFFSSRRRHTRCSRDWSSDVCSSDLLAGTGRGAGNGCGCGARRLARWLASWLAYLRRFALLQLNVVQVADRLVVDTRHHVFEQDKTFLLELDERILLPVTAQADALFQMVKREQVIFPLRIDHIEDDAPLEPAHQFRAELFFFFLVTLGDGRHGCRDEFIMA